MTLQKCAICGEHLTPVREREYMQMGARAATIEVDRYRCSSCGELFTTPEQMVSAQQRLAGVLREQEGLLRPDEIRRFREEHELTQAQLERIIGSGPKTVVRWERGTVFQGAANDLLLRILANVPNALEFAAQAKGVSLSRPLPCPNLAQTDSKTVRVAMPSPTRTGPGDKVTNIQFGRERFARKLRPGKETALPVIKSEALK